MCSDDYWVFAFAWDQHTLFPNGKYKNMDSKRDLSDEGEHPPEEADVEMPLDNRDPLPIVTVKAELMEMIRTNQVTVVTGDTVLLFVLCACVCLGLSSGVLRLFSPLQGLFCGCGSYLIESFEVHCVCGGVWKSGRGVCLCSFGRRVCLGEWQVHAVGAIPLPSRVP